MRTLVIGDIHGNYKALMQCLERSKFDKDNDRLICLGDIVDGFPQTKECIEELLTLKYCFKCLGNHDYWAIQYYGAFPLSIPTPAWLKQGGKATLDSYGECMDEQHLEFLKNFYPYIIIDEMLFVHGGFDCNKSIEDQDLDELIWNRQMVETAWKKTIRNQKYKFGPYNDIFVGHTTTQCFGIWEEDCIIERRPVVPLNLCNAWLLDTGAGWDGKLTIMDVTTKEYWQSDLALSLYPGMGRGLRFND